MNLTVPKGTQATVVLGGQSMNLDAGTYSLNSEVEKDF